MDPTPRARLDQIPGSVIRASAILSSVSIAKSYWNFRAIKKKSHNAPHKPGSIDAHHVPLREVTACFPNKMADELSANFVCKIK